jgi:hypothetical protein
MSDAYENEVVGVPPMTRKDWTRLVFARWDDKCAICAHCHHLSPECLPCPEHTHCVRRGPHESCLYDHFRPGGAYFPDPSTGRSPLDDAIAAEKG